MYWPLHKTLIISDPHLGKAGHFRKSGIAIPQQVFVHDLQKLVTLLQVTKAERLIVTGDFFHSTENKELVLFKKWRQDFASLRIELMMGNHDILPFSVYASLDIQCHASIFESDGLVFCHDISSKPKNTTAYCFCGHLHPGVHISAKGKQSLLLPCFYFTSSYSILPAFGSFTGFVPVRAKKGDRVIAITEKELIEIKSKLVL